MQLVIDSPPPQIPYAYLEHFLESRHQDESKETFVTHRYTVTEVLEKRLFKRRFSCDACRLYWRPSGNLGCQPQSFRIFCSATINVSSVT